MESIRWLFLWLTCPYKKGPFQKENSSNWNFLNFSGGKYSALVFQWSFAQIPLGFCSKTLAEKYFCIPPWWFASFRPPASTAFNGAHFEVFVVEPKKKAAVFFNKCMSLVIKFLNQNDQEISGGFPYVGLFDSTCCGAPWAPGDRNVLMSLREDSVTKPRIGVTSIVCPNVSTDPIQHAGDLLVKIRFFQQIQVFKGIPFPIPNGRTTWLLHWGHYLLTGMILQVLGHFVTSCRKFGNYHSPLAGIRNIHVFS